MKNVVLNLNMSSCLCLPLAHNFMCHTDVRNGTVHTDRSNISKIDGIRKHFQHDDVVDDGEKTFICALKVKNQFRVWAEQKKVSFSVWKKRKTVNKINEECKSCLWLVRE